MSRDNILHRIRTAIGRSAGQAVADPPPVRLRIPEVDMETRIDSHDRARRSAGRKGRCDTGTKPARIGGGGDRRQDRGRLQRARTWRECGITALPGVRSGITDRDELRELCATADVGITSADYALADTGTLVMLSSPQEARLISLLPPAHIAVVPRERILTGLDELFTILPNPAVADQLDGADHRPQPHRRYRTDPGARRARPGPDHSHYCLTFFLHPAVRPRNRQTMNLGIIGTGNVGGTLGRRFAQLGHSVAFGSRRPDSAEMAELAGQPNARVVSPREAAQSAEVVVLATPWPNTAEALRGLGDLAGKIVLDCTNPLKPDLSGLSLANTTSAGEQVADWAPGARVVKIFNTVGYGVMANPAFGSESATMLYCGDDAAAKAVAHDLAAQLGFDPVDAGPLKQARVIETLALLWISLVFGGQGPNIAFRLMHR